MDLEKSIEWLSRHGATVRFETERLTVSVGERHVQRKWTQTDVATYRGSVPCRELVDAAELLEHDIGS